MIFPTWLPVYGDQSFRGKCPTEDAEHVTIINLIRKTDYGPLLIHPRNEGKRTANQAAWEKARGMSGGASDLIIPASPAFLCELKRADHTKSHWQDGQIEYLGAAKDVGAFVCVALGHSGAWEAFQAWRRVVSKTAGNQAND